MRLVARLANALDYMCNLLLSGFLRHIDYHWSTLLRLLQKAKAAIDNRGLGLNLLESSQLWLTRFPRKHRRSRYSGKPVVAKLPAKRGKSRHEQ
jgi:hypothetical protein